MKKYVILGFISGMGGGELYASNKVDYLNKRGWKTYAFGYTDENIILENLKQFEGNAIPEFSFIPSLFPRRKQCAVVRDFFRRIHFQDGDRVIIESGSVAFSMWAELLAEHVQGKNFVFLLDPYFHNISDDQKDFFIFKLKRGELACTTAERTEELFGNYPQAKDLGCPALRACCQNSVFDVTSDVVENITALDKVDFTLANCGRIDKPYTKEFIIACCQFADRFPDKQMRIIMIGGDIHKTEHCNTFSNMVAVHPNLSIFFTGLLFPIPKKIFGLADVCVGSSGSAAVVPHDQLPTICVRDDDIRPLGVMGYDGFDCWPTKNAPKEKALPDVFEDILIHRLYQNKPYSFHRQIDIDKEFNRHMNVLDASDSEPVYYDVKKMLCPKRQHILKWMMHALGLRITKMLLRQRSIIMLRR